VREDQVIAAVHACNGPGWKLLHLRSAADVLAAQPQANAPVPTDIGLVGPCAPDDATQFELRAFFTGPTGRITEDPVTGSLNASVAMYLIENGFAPDSYTAAQGCLTGADGTVTVSRDDQGIWIGGQVLLIAQGADLAF
jgi:predicted PhzF superfamily epimerase YddE/YHI9